MYNKNITLQKKIISQSDSAALSGSSLTKILVKKRWKRFFQAPSSHMFFLCQNAGALKPSPG